MGYNDKIDYVKRLAIDGFAAVGSISGVAVLEEVRSVGVTTAAFDFLAPVANHLYYIDSMTVTFTAVGSGAGAIVAYDITPTAQTMIALAQAVSYSPNINQFFCTRLAHVAGAGGTYFINYIAFDLTYL